MSKRKPTPPKAATEPALELPPTEPLKPRKGLFVVLCVTFAVWVGFLTTLYFKTVYGKVDPHAHRAVEEVPGRGR